MSQIPLYGLVLSGGQSLRMGRDKGSLVYNKKDQRARSSELLSEVCEKVFISIRPGQENLISPGQLFLVDSVEGGGPGVGMLTASAAYPGVAWFVFACDFPFADATEFTSLARSRNPESKATAMVSRDDQIEPLFAIWEPEALAALREDFSRNQFSPKKTLSTLRVKKIVPLHEKSILNVNSETDLPSRG
jgi:molybdopterin-guanine dinucleotide biosynthesis protein A